VALEALEALEVIEGILDLAIITLIVDVAAENNAVANVANL